MAVILCDIEQFSYKEIAAILDVPIGTVMSRIHRGRKLLQQRLWDYAVEHGLAPADSGEDSGAGHDGTSEIDAGDQTGEHTVDPRPPASVTSGGL